MLPLSIVWRPDLVRWWRDGALSREHAIGVRRWDTGLVTVLCGCPTIVMVVAKAERVAKVAMVAAEVDLVGDKDFNSG